jgi:hypothetical protein
MRFAQSTDLNNGKQKLTTVLNTKAIYAAGGGIAVAAVAVFFLLGPGLAPRQATESTDSRPQVIPPVLAIKDITTTQVDDENAQVKITFTVENPNNTTVLLENIHYDISVDGKRMIIGDVGESPEGFLASQGSIFTIVSGSTLTVSDTQTAERNSAVAEEWDRMVAGDATFVVDGMYFYRLTAGNLDTSTGEQQFTLTFP